MRPIGWGLAAALFVAMLAPAAVVSAPKAQAVTISDKERKQGMAEAPALVQQAGLSCQVSDARYIGATKDPKTKAATNYYEVACGQSMGFIVQAATGQTPTVFSCIEAAGGNLACALPGNSDPKAQLAPAVAKAGIQCTPKAARGVGSSKTNSFVEVACQEGPGYILIASAPFDASKPVQAQNCLSFDEAAQTAVKCTLSDKASRLAVIDSYAKGANNGCVVKDRRYVGTVRDGSEYFEAACQDGKGYMYKVNSGRVTNTLSCGQASNIAGGCTLTDSRQATADQAALYTRLAHNAGSTCDVDHYAVFPQQGADERVEMICKNGQGAIGVFPPTGKGQVVDCGRALALGIQCSLGADRGYASLTADLKKFQPKSTCVVSQSRAAARTSKGTALIEVACADKFKGYVIEYRTTPDVAAVGVAGCAFSGDCKLPGNV